MVLREVDMNKRKNWLTIGLMMVALQIWCVSQSQEASTTSSGVQNSQDGMVLIPGGEFVMGITYPNVEIRGKYIDNPAHAVKVDPFYLDKAEVTNAEYFRFCQATGHRFPFFWGMRDFRSGLDFPNNPVTGVSWKDAQDFAMWRGVRLPTEAEWEFAARGGLEGKTFPKGDTLEPADACYAPQAHGPEPVGKFKPNAYGLSDMVGNVGEWVADYYQQDYYVKGPRINPPGPDLGCFRVVRGGGWYSGKMCNTVCSRTALPTHWIDFNTGFRCARSANEK
jgi:formylglycine-generating enzyme required for sulfatase activity